MRTPILLLAASLLITSTFLLVAHSASATPSCIEQIVCSDATSPNCGSNWVQDPNQAVMAGIGKCWYPGSPPGQYGTQCVDAGGEVLGIPFRTMSVCAIIP